MWRNLRVSVLGVVIIIFHVYQKVTELFALKLCDRRMRRWWHSLGMQGGEAEQTERAWSWDPWHWDNVTTFVSLLQLNLPGNTLTDTPGFFLPGSKSLKLIRLARTDLYIYMQTPVMLTVAHDSRQREVAWCPSADEQIQCDTPIWQNSTHTW